MEIENINLENNIDNQNKSKPQQEFKYTYLDSGPFEIYIHTFTQCTHCWPYNRSSIWLKISIILHVSSDD